MTGAEKVDQHPFVFLRIFYTFILLFFAICFYAPHFMAEKVACYLQACVHMLSLSSDEYTITRALAWAMIACSPVTFILLFRNSIPLGRFIALVLFV